MKLCIECRTAFDSDDWHCPTCGFIPEMAGDWPTFRADLVGTGPKEFDSSTYERMSAFEESSFYCQSRLRLIQWALTKFFPTAGNFYDFGAGTGYRVHRIFWPPILQKRRIGAAASPNPLMAPVTMAIVCASPEVHRTVLGNIRLTKLPSSSYD